ncbi:hypothetical protein [Ralstonia solanacearum]|uniref:hypothetical protein n=1 Tax=Ralstonia solanacearum TaxID=305 RepID=UPI0012D3041C|nr:hypothetical protein [Ralstonia solanacearum]
MKLSTWFYIWEIVKMAQALYDVEQIDNGAKRFTVRPLPLNGAWEKIQLAIAAVILAGLFIGLASANVVLAVVLVGGTALLCVWLRSMKLKGANRGRRLTQFTAGPAGITLDNGTALARADLERIYITAPAAGETVVYSGIGSGGTYTGVSSTGGVGKGIAARSWQVVVQARGVEHWLGGGLTQPMASSLSVQVERALNGQ